jgi:hypothetical protein
MPSCALRATLSTYETPLPPRIVGASNCNGTDVWSVTVAGGDPQFGGTYVVYINNPIVPYSRVVARALVGSTGTSQVTVDISSHLARYPMEPLTGWAFQAVEERRTNFGLEISPSSQNAFLRDPTALTAPFIAPAPLWQCGRATASGGHQPGDLILLTTPTSTLFTIPAANGPYDFVGEIIPGFNLGDDVYSTYYTCSRANVSPTSLPQRVQKYPAATLPRIPSSTVESGVAFIAGVSRFSVLEVANGAVLNVTYTRAGKSFTLRRPCAGGEPCVLGVPSAFGTALPGDTVEARQELCAGSESAPSLFSFAGCASRAPTALQPKTGDQQVVLTGVAVGATVTVRVCGTFWNGDRCSNNSFEVIGEAFNALVIPLTRPLRSAERIVLTQAVSRSCPPVLGNLYTALRE